MCFLVNFSSFLQHANWNSVERTQWPKKNLYTWLSLIGAVPPLNPRKHTHTHAFLNALSSSVSTLAISQTEELNLLCPQNERRITPKTFVLSFVRSFVFHDARVVCLLENGITIKLSQVIKTLNFCTQSEAASENIFWLFSPGFHARWGGRSEKCEIPVNFHSFQF